MTKLSFLFLDPLDPYTRQYDLDLVREVAGDQIASSGRPLDGSSCRHWLAARSAW